MGLPVGKPASPVAAGTRQVARLRAEVAVLVSVSTKTLAAPEPHGACGCSHSTSGREGGQLIGRCQDWAGALVSSASEAPQGAWQALPCLGPHTPT